MSWILNPFTGDFQYVPPNPTESLSAKRLEIDKIASEDILSLEPVYLLVDTTMVGKAGVDSKQKSTVFGIALSNALAGESVRVLMFGYYEDVSLNFPLNASLFQSAAGQLSAQATTIVGEYWCDVGISYGTGAIFVNPQPSVEVR